MRTERCVCGGYIRAASLVTSRQAVQIHQMTLHHLEWRYLHYASPGLDMAAPDDPRRHWPTADGEPVDSVQGDVGASTGGVEGAA